MLPCNYKKARIWGDHISLRQSNIVHDSLAWCQVHLHFRTKAGIICSQVPQPGIVRLSHVLLLFYFSPGVFSSSTEIPTIIFTHPYFLSLAAAQIQKAPRPQMSKGNKRMGDCASGGQQGSSIKGHLCHPRSRSADSAGHCECQPPLHLPAPACNWLSSVLSPTKCAKAPGRECAWAGAPITS